MTFANQKMLFLSDVHLGGFAESENRRIEASLIRLIDYCEQEKYQMCILGDLFDYWMEYPAHAPSLGGNILDRFRSYNDRAGSTLFITGNHDNWTRGHFKKLGFDVEHNYRRLTLNMRQVLLLHGDGLVGRELTIHRPPLHRLLRNASFINLYQKLLPQRSGLWLMKYFSRLNRYFEEFRAGKKTLNNWAKLMLKQTEFDIIICGHDHCPRMRNFSFGTFINLGTFYKHKTLATYTNGTFSLVVWNDESRELRPFYPE